MEPDRSPAQLIAESKGLLLDFDGPVCDVYAGSDPARIAREVATTFELGVDTDDPLELITHALATDGPVDDIHQALTETEIEAVRTATETPGIRQLVESYHGPMAVVSNNAAEAIAAWLDQTELRPKIEVIIGRDPRRMKPDPWGLSASAVAIGCRVDQCVFVGDSITDVQAALGAGTTIIALASTPAEQATFEAYGCTTIVTTVTELVVSGSSRNQKDRSS